MRTVRGVFLLGLLGSTALLGNAAQPASAAEPLGRLFTTPEQRQALDALRDTGSTAPADAAGLAPSAATPVDRQVVLNGVVSRSLGPDVVWVNGARTGAADARVRLRQGPDRSNRVTLEDATDGSSVRLKPGQYWEPATGRVADCYGCGAPAKSPDAAPAPAEVTADKP
jgi:hypothetical protein